MKNSLIACLSVCGLLASSASARDWTQFRGPGGLGVSDESGLPVTWNDSDNVAWKASLPGYGASSPITLGDRVYVTCYSGYGTGSGGSMEEAMGSG